MARDSVCKTSDAVFGLDEEKPRLINILAELCQCNPADIEWDGGGPVDIISFKTATHQYLLKLARESSQGRSVGDADFRVRVVIM